MNGFIYTLSDPRDGCVRYIGQTTRSLKIRLSEHIYAAKTINSHKSNWINQLISLGLKPVINQLEVSCELNNCETKWLSYAELFGLKLTNVLKSGGSGIRPATRKEVAKRHSELMKGRKLSEQHKQAIKIGCSYKWVVIYPNGTEELVINMNDFCKLHKLNRGAMSLVASGKASHHKGFKCHRKV